MASHLIASLTAAARPTALAGAIVERAAATCPAERADRPDRAELRPRVPPAERVAQLSRASFAELEDLYLRAPNPTRLPRGRAVGEHVLAKDGNADLPWLVELAATRFWRSKDFDPQAGVVHDNVTLFPDTEAKLSLGVMNGHRAVITDYTAVDNFPVKVKWVDEFREIEPNVWLGRSFYDGEFWAHVILRFEGA